MVAPLLGNVNTCKEDDLEVYVVYTEISWSFVLFFTVFVAGFGWPL